MSVIQHTDASKYSRDGRIVQVEYAMKAMNHGTTTIGVVLKDCVILVSEKKLSGALQLPCTVKKHFKIYDSIACGISGVSGDAPTIIKKCREFCIQHEKMFSEQIKIEHLMEKICALALKFGEDDPEKMIFSRPFGVSLLVAAYENGPHLYSIDPSGSYLEYKAHSIGFAQEVVEGMLVEKYDLDASTETTIREMISILKDVMKEKMSKHNVEIMTIGAEGVLMLTPEEVAEYF
ncbi:20S proteasome subunit alpha 5 [Pancytospora epiphaga]|nr:20S proteasome subunit alpha 5 [Pancytospora epiphaga]